MNRPGRYPLPGELTKGQRRVRGEQIGVYTDPDSSPPRSRSPRHASRLGPLDTHVVQSPISPLLRTPWLRSLHDRPPSSLSNGRQSRLNSYPPSSPLILPQPFARCPWMITAAVTAGTSHDFHVYGWFQNGMEDLRVTPLWHSASGSELSGDIPSARFDCGVAYSEGKFILWGGHTGTNRDSRIINELDDRVYILDTVRGTWTSSQHRSKYPSQPTGRWGHSATMVGRKFTVFGGQFLHQLLDHLWVLDMESGSWDLVKPRPGFPKPAARLGHSCVAQSDEIFIFGGTNGRQCFKDLWKFNFDDRQWSELSPSGGSPPPRHGHAVALLNGVLYILGGRDGDDKELADLFALRLSDLTWHDLSFILESPPTAGFGPRCAMVTSGTDLFFLYGFSRPRTVDPTRSGNDAMLISVLKTELLWHPGWASPVIQAGREVGKTYSLEIERRSPLEGSTYPVVTLCADFPQLDTASTRWSSLTSKWFGRPLLFPEVHRTLSLLTLEVIARTPSNAKLRLLGMLESSLVAFTSHDLVRSLGQSKPFCRGLLDILSMAGISSDHEVVQWAIDLGDASDASSLQIIIDSPTLKQLVLSLRGDDAVSFSDFLCNIIGKRALASHRSRSKLNRNRINYPFPDHRSFPHVLRRLLVALAEASEALPSGLFLQGVQALQNRDPLYGGGSSDIFKGNYGSAVVALKRLRFFELAPEDRPKVHKQFCRESLLWQMLEHPNILPFLGIDKETSQPHLCMVLPWMENGHILQYLKKNDIPPSSRLRAQLLLEVAEGLAYLHSENVVHGDMRANNILVDDQGHARITDFGLAVFAEVTRQSLSSDYRGSLRWLAPELVRSTGQQGAMAGQKVHRTRESDVWAYGCVFLEVYTGHPPFPEEKNDYQVVVQIALGARPTCPPCRTATDRHRWALVETCWHPQPSERPTMQAVIETLELDVVVYMDE